MLSSRTILKNLKNVIEFLNKYKKKQRPIYFEKLIAESFSHILFLPFYTKDDDILNVPHRVTWNGSNNTPSCAPGNNPDAIAYCYEFYIMIEATKTKNTSQWSREFAPSIRHCINFCTNNKIESKDAFILLISTKIHEDTYRSIMNYPNQEYKFIPLEISELIRILQTSILVISISHFEIRKLFNDICESFKLTSSIGDFKNNVNSIINNWQKNVLNLEENFYIGLKSYEAMHKIGETLIGVSQIYNKLQKHPFVLQYLNIIGKKPNIKDIEQYLIQQSFASFRFKTTSQDESFFEPIPLSDYKGRSERIVKEIMKIKI